MGEIISEIMSEEYREEYSEEYSEMMEDLYEFVIEFMALCADAPYLMGAGHSALLLQSVLPLQAAHHLFKFSPVTSV